jgi:hypothetical protein
MADCEEINRGLANLGFVPAMKDFPDIFERGSKRAAAIETLSDALRQDGIQMRPEDVALKITNLTIRVRRKLALMERNNNIRFWSHELIIAKMMQDAKSSS